jgi:hypothetical protein
MLNEFRGFLVIEHELAEEGGNEYNPTATASHTLEAGLLNHKTIVSKGQRNSVVMLFRIFK